MSYKGVYLARSLHANRADTMTTTTLSTNLQDIISPKFHQNNFAEELYIKNDLGIKLDKGSCPTSNTCVQLRLP